MQYLLGFLPLVAFLACPLMMVVCFLGMRQMGCAMNSRSSAGSSTPATQMGTPEQVAVLQTRLERLQAEQAAIATQLTEIAAANSEAIPTTTASAPHVVPVLAAVRA